MSGGGGFAKNSRQAFAPPKQWQQGGLLSAQNPAQQQATQGLLQGSWRLPANWQPRQTKALANPRSYASGLRANGFLPGAVEQDNKWRMQAQALGVPMHQLQAKFDEMKAAGLTPPGGW